MSKPASPALIGSFVVGAITLAIVGMALFGAGKLFRKTIPFIMYFDGDVNGLKVGAPVKFKGVEIGSVTNVLLNMGGFEPLDSAAEEPRIPVLIELDQERITEKGGRVRLDDKDILKRLIDRGLRAQLSMESFVTGLLYVKLDMFPDSPLRLVADPQAKYPEIPTIPTPLEEAQAVASGFLKKLDQVDFAGLMKSISNVAEGLDKLVNSPDLKDAVSSVNKAIDNLNATVTSFRNVANEVDQEVGPLAKSLRAAVDDADAAIKEASATIASINSAIQPDSPLMYQLRTTMEGLSATARTVRLLADYLERNPTALLRGKLEPEGDR